jgi:hypothetical protein
MTRRTLIILLAAFVILVAIAATPWLKDQFGSSKDDDNPTVSEIDFSGYTEGLTSTVTITAPGGKPMVLAKQGGAWTINGAKAATTEVDAFFKSLTGSKDPTLVSKNPKKHAAFGADATAGTVLELRRGSHTEKYIVGRAGDTGATFFVKQQGSKNLYEVTGDLPTQLSKDLPTWLGKAPKTPPPPPGGMPSVQGLPPGVGAPPGT